MIIQNISDSLECEALHQHTISSIIRQKGESQNGCLKKTKHANVRVRIMG